MDRLKPATNVQLGAAAGFISAMILHICQANGIIIPADVSAGLPAFIVAVVSYAHDCYSEKKNVPDQTSSGPAPNSP